MTPAEARRKVALERRIAEQDAEHERLCRENGALRWQLFKRRSDCIYCGAPALVCISPECTARLVNDPNYALEAYVGVWTAA